MTSIRSKITTLALLCVLLCTAITAGMGLWFVHRAQQWSSNQVLTLTCLEQTGRLNQELRGVEGSVDACAELVSTSLRSIDLADDDAYYARLDDLELQVGSIAQNTSGVCTYYLRVGREQGVEPDGFFYTRHSLDADLIEERLTRISDFDPADTEHVGWYYQPAQAGRAIWMAPYYNQNIDVYMVSYVAPIYVGGVFRGVVGMDVNFDVIIDAIRHIKPYQTGTASLVSDDGVIYFHPDAPSGTLLTEMVPELAPMVEQLPQLEEGTVSDTADFTLNGVRKKMAFCGLRNGMALMLAANTAEINAPVMRLLGSAAVAAAVMSGIVLLVVMRISDRITKPLVQLTGAAERIAEGDLDVQLPPPTNDEVGVLTRGLDVTLGSLRELVAGMNVKAYRDALTSVKNKTAYDEAMQQLQQQMDEGPAEFGLLMVDVNYLKAINDQHGHERGDQYLRTCCQLVCRVFEHSPVYRIGGDEFVVVLQREDLEHCDELLAQLDQRMRESQGQDEPWQRISLAKGLAVRSEQDTSVEDVFRRADQAMYEDKTRMKAGR